METLSDDLLIGAAALAEYVLRDRSKRRKIYHMAQQGLIPVFKIGPELAGRKSTLLRFIGEREQAIAVTKTAA